MRLRSWVVGFVAVIVGGVLCALLVELTARAAYRRGRYSPKVVNEVYLQKNPYLGNVLKPGSRTQWQSATIDVNALGFRGAEFSPRKPAGVYRIFVLGGSTTFGYPGSIPRTEDTYPYKMQGALRAQLGTSQIEVINAGVTGYTLRTSLVNYATRLTWYEPDMIVVYHGVNDLILTKSEQDLYESVIRAEPGPTIVEQIRDSSFLLLELNYRVFKHFRHPAFADQPAARSDRPVAAALTAYERNLRHLVEMAKADGVAVVIGNESTWIPPICEASAQGETPLDETTARTCFGLTWYFSNLSGEGLRRSFEAVAEIQRRVAAEHGLIWADMNPVVPGGPEYYWDFCHTRPSGTTLIADEFARQISNSVRRTMSEAGTP